MDLRQTADGNYPSQPLLSAPLTLKAWYVPGLDWAECTPLAYELDCKGDEGAP